MTEKIETSATSIPLKTELAPMARDKNNFSAADNLPSRLPTDADVLNTNLPTQPTNLDIAQEEEELEEVVAPIIESIIPEKNEVVEQAKDIITGNSKIEEFNLDNEEDSNFLKELGYGKEKEAITTPVSESTSLKDAKALEFDLEAKYAPYKEKASAYDAVLEDPLTKALIEFRKSGKTDLNEFAQQVGFVNVEAMTAKEVIEHQCKLAGLTEEETEAELESLNTMTPLTKKNYIDSAKDKMKSERDEKLKAFTAGNQETMHMRQQAVQSGMKQLDELIPKMVDKKYEGLLITSEMANNIKREVQNNAKQIVNEKGQVVGYDIKTSVEAAVATLYKNEWKKAIFELGRTVGADKTLTARTRPNKKIATSGAAPLHQESLADTAKSMADEKWAKQMGNKPNTKK